LKFKHERKVSLTLFDLCLEGQAKIETGQSERGSLLKVAPKELRVEKEGRKLLEADDSAGESAAGVSGGLAALLEFAGAPTEVVLALVHHHGASQDVVLAGQRQQRVHDLDLDEAVVVGHHVAQVAHVAHFVVRSAVHHLQTKQNLNLKKTAIMR